MEEVGARIRSMRKAAGLTQEELASRIGVSRSTVNKWENGAYSFMSTLHLERLVAALGCGVEEILKRK